MKCTCKIIVIKNKAIVTPRTFIAGIDLCPLHEAAPVLLKALEEIIGYLDNNNNNKNSDINDSTRKMLKELKQNEK